MPLTENAKRIVLQGGCTLFRQGDIAKAAYLIQMGKVKITMEHGGHSITLAEIGPGEIIGEMALLSGGKAHSATAETTEETYLIEIDGSQLNAKYETSDPTMKKIIFCLVNRLHNTNIKLFGHE